MIVDLMSTDDQAMIAESVGAFFADRLPVERFRDPGAWGGATEAGLWRALAELGLFGLGVPAERGGVGYALAEEVTVAHAAGLHLISPSLIATMVAAHVGDAGTYAAGKTRVAFANPVRPGSMDVQVIDGEGAEQWLLTTPDGTSLVTPGAVAPVAGMDETISLARATIAIESEVATASGDAVFRRSELLLAAYLSGLSRAALEMAVEYAKVREQFGQPIGAFQAIKHICADMALRTEAAFSQTCYAAALAGAGDPESGAVASARLLAGNAALENAHANIQVHGGMGFTDESDAHYFLKRAHLLTLLNSSKYALQLRILAAA